MFSGSRIIEWEKAYGFWCLKMGLVVKLRLSGMLDSDNSFIRTRGLILLSYNAKWDKDNKIDEVINKYLKHVIDVKPITARQCIKLLPIIAKYKPELKNDILSALYKANIDVYDDSMQPLVYKDIQKAYKSPNRD